MNGLAREQCSACRPDSPRVTEHEQQELLREIPEWRVVEREGVPQLTRAYKFKNFADALAFTNRVGELAEQQDHHRSRDSTRTSCKVWRGRALPPRAPNDILLPNRAAFLRRARSEKCVLLERIGKADSIALMRQFRECCFDR